MGALLKCQLLVPFVAVVVELKKAINHEKITDIGVCVL